MDGAIRVLAKLEGTDTETDIYIDTEIDTDIYTDRRGLNYCKKN